MKGFLNKLKGTNNYLNGYIIKLKCFFKLKKINLFAPNFTVKWYKLGC